MARDYNREGLQAAARVVADVFRKVAMVRTRRTADAINIQIKDDVAYVRGGKPEGPYGWEPITAYMFDDNARHPFFGDRRKWYAQGGHKGAYPITQIVEEQAADPACKAYTESAIDQMLADRGFK